MYLNCVADEGDDTNTLQCRVVLFVGVCFEVFDSRLIRDIRIRDDTSYAVRCSRIVVSILYFAICNADDFLQLHAGSWFEFENENHFFASAQATSNLRSNVSFRLLLIISSMEECMLLTLVLSVVRHSVFQ